LRGSMRLRGGRIKSPKTGGKPLQRLIVMRIAGRPGGGQGSLPPKSEHNLPPEGREAQEGCHLLGEVRGTGYRGNGSPRLCLVELEVGLGLSHRVVLRERLQLDFHVPGRWPPCGRDRRRIGTRADVLQDVV
jgi:hypothetical protein